MAQYYKPKENVPNESLKDYFYLNPFNNYDKIYIINNDEYDSFIKKLIINSITIISNDGEINDHNPIYLNLNRLTSTNTIYLKEYQNLLDDDNIIAFIETFKGIIILDTSLVSYLRNIGILHEDFTINKNTYLIIDRYGKSELIELNN